MGLLRNASGLLIPDSTGRLGRADDPEFHIRRLEHFGKGMGIDVASTHPIFSAKKLKTSAGSPHMDSLEFQSHDEGLMMSEGHSAAAVDAIDNDRSGYGGKNKEAALDELRHRSAYQHNVYRENEDLKGAIYKDTSELIPTEHPFVRPAKWVSSHWGSDANNGIYTDAMKAVSNRFQEFNRNRQGPNATVAELTNKVINNPSESFMRDLQRSAPNTLGSQFLGVLHGTPYGHTDTYDQIDLNTGNWAKIDPEGYFPY
jgi:hypothetical protein